MPENAFPLMYKTIMIFQNKDKELLEKFKSARSNLEIKTFHGAGKKRALICENGKIYSPSALCTRVVEWYHNQLCHPGKIRREVTIKQLFT